MNKKEALMDLAAERTGGVCLPRKIIWNFVYNCCRAVLLFGLCFLILQPLLDKLSVSFMEQRDLYDGTVISIPRHFTLGNYLLA